MANRRIPMTNADEWARVVQAHTRHADLLPQRVWAIRKDGQDRLQMGLI